MGRHGNARLETGCREAIQGRTGGQEIFFDRGPSLTILLTF
jgi:hypothetical protein